jgi:hypothetical protein
MSETKTQRLEFQIDLHTELLTFNSGGCRIASNAEIALWKELAAAREALRRLDAVLDFSTPIDPDDEHFWPKDVSELNAACEAARACLKGQADA